MSTTSLLDRIEKVGRVVLWFAIASACVVLPIEYVLHKNALKREETKAEAELQTAVKRAEAKADELEKRNKSRRLTLASMGPYISGIHYSTAQGDLWFTNVSHRTGIVCVYGEAQDPETQKTSESIAACHEVGAYAAVHMSLMFAGGDLSSACPKSNCRVKLKEAAEVKEEKDEKAPAAAPP